jgi:hypothetical protein
MVMLIIHNDFERRVFAQNSGNNVASFESQSRTYSKYTEHAAETNAALKIVHYKDFARRKIVINLREKHQLISHLPGKSLAHECFTQMKSLRHGHNSFKDVHGKMRLVLINLFLINK